MQFSRLENNTLWTRPVDGTQGSHARFYRSICGPIGDHWLNQPVATLGNQLEESTQEQVDRPKVVVDRLA